MRAADSGLHVERISKSDAVSSYEPKVSADAPIEERKPAMPLHMRDNQQEKRMETVEEKSSYGTNEKPCT